MHALAHRTILITLFTLTLSVLANAQTGTLAGLVTDEDTNPVTCAAIVIEGPGDFRMSTTTDESGMYMVDGLVPGDYMVQVHAPNFVIAATLRTISFRFSWCVCEWCLSVKPSSG